MASSSIVWPSVIVKVGPSVVGGRKVVKRSEATCLTSYSAGECGICVLFRTGLCLHIFSISNCTYLLVLCSILLHDYERQPYRLFHTASKVK